MRKCETGKAGRHTDGVWRSLRRLPALAHPCYRNELDFNGDGTIDIRTNVPNTYDSKDRRVSSTSAVDSSGDATIDITSIVTTVYDGVKR